MTLKEVGESALGALLAIAASRYFGPIVWIPGIALILAYALAKLAKQLEAPFIHAIAFQSAQLAGFLVAGVLSKNLLPVVFDVLVFGSLLAWLIIRPGAVSVLVLGLCNFLVLLLNMIQLIGAEEPIASKALQFHALFRVVIIATLVYGTFKQHRISRDTLSGAGPSAS